MSNKGMQWIGDGVLHIKDKKAKGGKRKLKYGDVIPEGALDTTRLAALRRDGKIGSVPLPGSPGVVDGLERKIQSLQGDLKTVRAEKAEMQGKVESADADKKKIEGLSEDIKRLSEKVEADKATLADLKEQVKNLTAEKVKAEGDVKNLEAEKKTLSKERDDLKKNVADLNKKKGG